MKSKIIMALGILLAIIFVLPVAMAAEAINEVLPVEPTPELISASVENISLPDPGVTPDSMLYGLDRAMERIQLALTFNKFEKAKLGLLNAQERLAEVNTMIHENKTERAQEAQRAHDEIMTEVESNIDDLENSNATKEMENIVEIEAKVNEHMMLVEKVGDIMIKTKGTMTTEQQTMVDEMVTAMGNSTAKLKIEVQNKGESTKVKIKVQTGKSDAEVQGLTQEIQERYQLENAGESGVIKTQMDQETKSKVGSEDNDSTSNNGGNNNSKDDSGNGKD